MQRDLTGIIGVAEIETERVIVVRGHIIKTSQTQMETGFKLFLESL